MPRSTNSPASHARKKKVLKRAKGYRQGKSKQFRRAREFGERALTYARRDRRQKKRDFRSLWIIRISAGCKANGLSYSRFMNAWKDCGITLSRKSLAEIAFSEPEAFAALIRKVAKKTSK